MPIGGSASCTRVCSPEPRDDPGLVVAEVAAERDHAPHEERRDEGEERRQAEHERGRRGSGTRSSLKNSLMPSASVCSSPNGPALLGPMRFCMPAITLRSNHTMNIVPTRADDEDDDHLEHDDQQRRPERCAGRATDRGRAARSQPLQANVGDTRGGVDRIGDVVVPAWLNGTHTAPRGTARIGHHRERHRLLRR